MLICGFKSHLSHQKRDTQISTDFVLSGCFFITFSELLHFMQMFDRF